MWTLEPKPWIHLLTYPAMVCMPSVTLFIPQSVREAWPGLVFLSVGTMIVAVFAGDVLSNVVMMSNQIRDNKKDIRMFEQPTEEEKYGVKKLVREEVKETYVVKGNAGPIVIDKAPQTIRKTPPSFVAHQNTAQVVGLAEVDNAVRKICRRNVTLIEHPDLGYPDGDFREVTWVATKEMTRKSLLLAIAIIERHGGIERKGSAGNSTWIVKDLEVIKRGARTPLPHPIGCWCADCAEK